LKENDMATEIARSGLTAVQGAPRAEIAINTVIQARENTDESLIKLPASQETEMLRVANELALEAARGVNLDSFVTKYGQLLAVREKFQQRRAALDAFRALFDDLFHHLQQNYPELVESALRTRIEHLKNQLREQAREAEFLEEQIAKRETELNEVSALVEQYKGGQSSSRSKRAGAKRKS
jgi:hypothetical protein